jgi:hypothetical protein
MGQTSIFKEWVEMLTELLFLLVVGLPLWVLGVIVQLLIKAFKLIFQ